MKKETLRMKAMESCKKKSQILAKEEYRESTYILLLKPYIRKKNYEVVIEVQPWEEKCYVEL